MANKLDICNSALDKLGHPAISSLTDGSKAANLCNRNYDKLRKKLLRSHWWNFAIVRTSLTVDSTSPAWGYTSQYTLPGDNLRFLRLQYSEWDYRIEGGKLLTNYADSTINIMYIQDFDDVDSMDDTFKEGLAYLIASEIAYPLLQSRSLSTDMYNKYKIEISEIKTIDSQISSNAGMEANAWIDSRRSSGFTSADRSYYWD